MRRDDPFFQCPRRDGEGTFPGIRGIPVTMLRAELASFSRHHCALRRGIRQSAHRSNRRRRADASHASNCSAHGGDGDGGGGGGGGRVVVVEASKPERARPYSTPARR